MEERYQQYIREIIDNDLPRYVLDMSVLLIILRKTASWKICWGLSVHSTRHLKLQTIRYSS
jgi:hypothetical protein